MWTVDHLKPTRPRVRATSKRAGYTTARAAPQSVRELRLRCEAAGVAAWGGSEGAALGTSALPGCCGGKGSVVSDFDDEVVVSCQLRDVRAVGCRAGLSKWASYSAGLRAAWGCSLSRGVCPQPPSHLVDFVRRNKSICGSAAHVSLSREPCLPVRSNAL